MPRSVQWRRTVSDACCWHQTQAMDATIYILRQTGPTGFLLKEEGERKTVKVFLGDPHTCTCPVYKKERDLCKHICWLLLRKFRLSVNDPLSWQLGLVDIEVNEILRGRVTADQHRTRQANNNKKVVESADGRSVVEQREIAEDDVCPICQDEFMTKKLPVTYCKFGCGNSVHIKCMQVWAEHQQKTSQEGTIKCPMCREDFGPIDLLKAEMRNAGCPPQAPPGIRMDRHVGMACGHCSRAPIEGKCYRCTVCPTFHMCQRCFNLPVHTHHSFQFRHKRNQRWRAAARTLGSSLPPAIVNELQHRDITENDYDLLMQMDRHGQEELSNLSEDALNAIPLERVRDGSSLLAPGSQCRVCLRGFTVGQFVRKLPCRHKFHKDCIDSWLLHSHPNCPIDGIVVASVATGNRSQRSEAEVTDVNEMGPEVEQAHADNGLALTAFGIPMAASRLRDGSGRGRNDTRRRPHGIQSAVEHIGVGPQALQLQLCGRRVNSLEENSDSERLSAPQNVPGRRLLQQASQLRDRITQQLRSAHHDPSVAGAGDQLLTPADLIQFLASGSSTFGSNGQTPEADFGVTHLESRGNSASSITSTVSELDSVRQGRGRAPGFRSKRTQLSTTLRQRAGSLDRTGVASIQAIRRGSRDLYLGNDPLLQPATSEQPTTLELLQGSQAQRGRPKVFKPTFRGIRRPLNPGQAQSPDNRDLRLQGSGIDGNEEN